MLERLEVCDGKYELVFNNETGEFKCLRYGKQWRSLSGDQMVFGLFCELLEARTAKSTETANLQTNELTKRQVFSIDKQIENFEDKINEALHLAKSIMDYCQGDSWEASCTSQERKKFEEIYYEFFPEKKFGLDSELKDYQVKCETCGVVMCKSDFDKHINGKKHKKKIEQI